MSRRSRGNTKCELPNCDQPYKSNGYCGRHYNYWYRYGRIDCLCGKPFRAKGLCKECYETSPERMEKKRLNQERYRNSRKGKKYTMSSKAKFSILRTKAREFDHELTLSLEQYEHLNSLPCFYCDGELPTYGSGVDRLDSNLGYILGNVAPACTACNRIKNKYLSGYEMYCVAQLLKRLRAKK